MHSLAVEADAMVWRNESQDCYHRATPRLLVNVAPFSVVVGSCLHDYVAHNHEAAAEEPSIHQESPFTLRVEGGGKECSGGV